MSQTLRLSPKHGVNPTIPVCFFCGEDKQEIMLLGKIGAKNEDLEAPMRAVYDYEPCDKCKALMAQGITLIGVNNTRAQEGQPPIQKDLYPTGKWCVMRPEAVKRIFDLPDEKMEAILEKKMVLMDDGIVANIIEQNDKL